ncbi:MAG: tyrosine-type recombinase/integrase [Ignavibacteriaceae bacterium]
MFLSLNNKSPFYQIVYFVDGKRTTVSTKKRTLEEAEIELSKFQNPSSLPKEVTKPEISFQDRLTLSKFQTEYIDYVSSIKSRKYIESINLSFNQFISFCGNKNIEEINTLAIDKFITSTFARTQRGAHQYYRTLKAAFNKAVQWDHISANPFTKIKFPKLSKSYPVFITEDELLIIISSTPNQYLKDIFYVAFYTGLRLGELINMKWSWINFQQNHIVIKCSSDFLTKSKKDRVVPMAEKVRAILNNRFHSSQHKPDEFVFYHFKGIRLHQETISKQFKQVVRKVNLNDNIHFHTLRHSFASMLVQRGVSLYVVKELLGHEDLSTTQIYSHLQKQNLMDAVNLL